MIKPKDAINAGVVKKQYILGRRDDIEALEAMRPTYMKENIGDSIKKMGAERGITFVVDDTSESTHLVKVRPRYSWHGGNEPNALNRRDI